ncbi:MAG TPA: TolC family protein [Asticcacaulis sp.]|nr:TolC family protein [Asticcacaulis sp.]
MLRACLLLASSGLVLSACASYAPQPLAPPQLAAVTPLPAGAAATDLLALALQRSPDVAAARARLASALAARKASKAYPAITLTLMSEYSKDADPQRPWLWGAAADLPLDYGARRGARVTAADVDVMKARADLAEAVWRARQSLRSAQVRLTAARAVAVAARNLLDQRLALEAALQQRVAAGEEARDGVDTARLASLQAQQTLTQAQGDEQAALVELARALDTDASSVADLPAAASPQAGDGDDAMLYARPDILNAVADYDLSESQLRLAVAEQYPGVTVSPGYTWERGAVKLPLNLTLALPPLDGNRAHIDAAQAARLAAGKALEATVKSDLAAVAQARAQWRSAAALSQQIETHDAPLAAQMAARAAAAQRQGESDHISLMQAQIAAQETHLALVQAQGAADQARLALEDARHIPFDPAEARDLSAALTDTTQ